MPQQQQQQPAWHNRSVSSSSADYLHQYQLVLSLITFLVEPMSCLIHIKTIMLSTSFRGSSDFFSDWDPAALTESDEYGYAPLHHAATRANYILGFQSVSEYGIRYYPNKKGISLLFMERNIFI